MKKSGIFLGALLGLGVFSLASCDNGKEEINKLKEEISALTTENTNLKNDKTTLTEENTTLKSDKTALTTEKTQLESEVGRLSSIVYPNKDNTNCKISLEELNAISDISKISNDKDVIVKTYDIDDELLSIYKISLGENDTIFDKFVSLADVEYTSSEYGPYIQSIDGMIKDNKYYVSFFVNDDYANHGINELDQDLKDGDVITFKPDFNYYNNSTYDEIDVKVDKIIYNYYKHAKEYANKIGYVDYNLAFAFKKLESAGYEVDTTTLYSNTVKSLFTTNPQKYSSDGNVFKTTLAYYCAGLDISEAKGEYTTRDVNVDGEWVDTTLAYYYNVGKVIGEISNDDFFIQDKLENYTLAMDETSCMIVTALKQIDSDKCQNFDQTLKPGFTENGFAYTAYGYDTCNCSSTAQAILAFGALGINIRNDDYKVNNTTDMIEALLSYYNEEDGLFYDFDGESEKSRLQFSTPQAVSALISYKLLKAGKSSNIYAA